MQQIKQALEESEDESAAKMPEIPASQKMHKTPMENFEYNLNYDYSENNEIFLMTARQKIRDWTRMYHKQQSAKWIKKHFAIPFWATFKKFEQSRNYQKLYATRILRREGYDQQWKPHALLNAVRVKQTTPATAAAATDTDHSSSDSTASALDFDAQDLDYFFYHKPPLGYLANDSNRITDDNPSTTINNSGGTGTDTIDVLASAASTKATTPTDTADLNDEQLLVECLNYCFEQELEKGYDLSYGTDYGKKIFTYLKKREKKYREFAAKKEKSMLDDKGLLKRKDPTKQLNMFLALPEENPRSEYIQYGSRYLSEYVDFKHAKVRDEKQKRNAQTAIAADAEDSPQYISAANTQPHSANVMSSENESTTAAAVVDNTSESTAIHITEDNNNNRDTELSVKEGAPAEHSMSTKFDDSIEVTDYRKTEGYHWNTRFRWFKGNKVPSISVEDNIKQLQSIDFDAKIKARSKSSMDYPTMKEDEQVNYKREIIDLRDDIKNSRSSAWFQFKRLFPQRKELRYLRHLYQLAWRRAWQQIQNDYRFVFAQGGGELLRQNMTPPQVSLMEFTVEDQLQTALGNFGAHHTLFADWFLVLDNKREECDRSFATADIVDDRLVFDGFLMHSGIEMGNRTRNFTKDWVGFANVASHEFEPELDLQGFHSVGLKLRTDGRTYFLGLECLNRNKFVLFNGIISLPPTPEGEWDYYEIPLHHFRPYYGGEFCSGESWHRVRWLRSMGIQAIGEIGDFHLEVAWMRLFREDARFDVEDEEIVFIQDLDGIGLYDRDLFNFNVIQHQFFIDKFPDPFRFEDDGVFDDFQYLGPPRAQREHFSKIPPNLLRYIDLCDDIPLDHISEDDRRELESLDTAEMMLLESHVNDRMIGDTKAVQHLYKHDNEAIETTTNAMLYKQLKRENETQKSIFFKMKKEYTKPPFRFHDFTQTSSQPLDVITRRRRELLRELVPEHLREREETRWPRLF